MWKSGVYEQLDFFSNLCVQPDTCCDSLNRPMQCAVHSCARMRSRKIGRDYSFELVRAILWFGPRYCVSLACCLYQIVVSTRTQSQEFRGITHLSDTATELFPRPLLLSLLGTMLPRAHKTSDEFIHGTSDGISSNSVLCFVQTIILIPVGEIYEYTLLYPCISQTMNVDVLCPAVVRLDTFYRRK
jgi:hypothetical protein